MEIYRLVAIPHLFSLLSNNMRGYGKNGKNRSPELVFHRSLKLSDLGNDLLIDTIAKRYYEQKIKAEIARGRG